MSLTNGTVQLSTNQQQRLHSISNYQSGVDWILPFHSWHSSSPSTCFSLDTMTIDPWSSMKWKCNKCHTGLKFCLSLKGICWFCYELVVFFYIPRYMVIINNINNNGINCYIQARQFLIFYIAASYFKIHVQLIVFGY